MKKVISVVLALTLICSVFFMTVSAAGRIGDANGDGKLTAIDARMVLQHVAGINTLEDTSNLDMNGDKKVTAVDARVILQVVAGIHEDPIKEQQLQIFVDSFNNVKKNAYAVTHTNSKLYNYNNYVYIHPVIEGLYNSTAGAGTPSLKEELTAEFSDELRPVNKTYKGEDIALEFPPMGGNCNLTMNDVSNISFEESGEYYIIEITVKGKKNPSRYESIGNVATIITKEDLESEMDPEDLEKMSLSCDYKDAVVKAKIEKETGKMIEYSVDYPMIMTTNITGIGKAIEIGMGFYEEWTIRY